VTRQRRALHQQLLVVSAFWGCGDSLGSRDDAALDGDADEHGDVFDAAEDGSAAEQHDDGSVGDCGSGCPELRDVGGDVGSDDAARPPAFSLDVRPEAVRPGDSAVLVARSEAEVLSVVFDVGGERRAEDAVAPFNALLEVATDSTEGVIEVSATATAVEGELTASARLLIDATPPWVMAGSPVPVQVDGESMLLFETAAGDNDRVAAVRYELADGSERWVTSPPWAVLAPAYRFGDARDLMRVTAYDRAGNASSSVIAYPLCRDGVPCGGLCVPWEALQTDRWNCGGCGVACPNGDSECVAGECACSAGRDLCGDSCVAVASDPDNCGGCGVRCSAGEECLAGFCAGAEVIRFLVVEPGTFDMGSSLFEPGREETETARRVTITRPFLLGATEVTQGQWSVQFPVNPSLNWGCGDRCPVDSVTWFEALSYANALSRADGLPECFELRGCGARPPGAGMGCTDIEVLAEEGNPLLCRGYRLPTEAEWEYAYRAGTTTAFYSGPFTGPSCDDVMHLLGNAWFQCNAERRSHPVALLGPNAWGFHDMAGNVSEWVWDSWQSEVVAEEVVDPLGYVTTTEKVTKGGDYLERADRLRAASRLSVNAFGEPRPVLGFRVARTLHGD